MKPETNYGEGKRRARLVSGRLQKSIRLTREALGASLTGNGSALLDPAQQNSACERGYSIGVVGCFI